MQFETARYERQFIISFNRGALKTDFLYASSLAAFCLSAIQRLLQMPDGSAAVVAASGLLSYLPLLLLVNTLWPEVYMRHRQLIVSCLKVCAAFLATLFPDQYIASLVSSDDGGSSPVELLARTGLGLSSQLALHSIGMQTTGSWLVFSQGFAVAASARTAVRCCRSALAPVMRQVLQDHAAPYIKPSWRQSMLVSDPVVPCLAFTLGLQIAVGYCLPVVLGLLTELRQRQAFALKHKLLPPGTLDFLQLHSCVLVMLLFLGRVALAEVSAAAAGGLSGGTCGALAAVIL